MGSLEGQKDSSSTPSANLDGVLTQVGAELDLPDRRVQRALERGVTARLAR